MSAPQFTPGPWSVVAQSGFTLVGAGHSATTRRENWIAQLNYDQLSCEANARLIAAAPRMYRQLEIFVSTIVNDDMLSLDLDLAREADEAAAILKEARGDQ